MLPTINKRFLLVMLVSTGILAGALAGVHTVQARRIPDALKRQSDRAKEAGKKDAAIGYLRQYLEFKPDDVEAQIELAELVKNRTAGGRPVYELLLLYERILRIDAARHAIRREALDLALALRRYTDAELHVELLLKEFPGDAGLWRSLSTVQIGLHQPAEKVRKSLEEAIRLEPGHPAAYHLLAGYLLRESHLVNEAKAVLDRLVAARPDDAESYVSRAVFASMSDEAKSAPLDGAIHDLRKALEIQPKNAEALLLLSEQLQRGRDLSAAADLLAVGIREYPKDVRFVRNLSWLELNRGNIGASVSVLEGAIDRMPRDESFELIVPLADLLVQLGETDRSRDLLLKLESRTTRDAKMQAKYIRGRLAMREDHWDDAIGELLDLRADTLKMPGLENQTNLLLAQCYRKKGNPAKEIECLTLLTNRDAQHVAGREALGRAYQNAGRFDEAIREFELAARSPYSSINSRSTLLRMKAVQLRALTGANSPSVWDALEAEAKDAAAKAGPGNSDGVLLRAEIAALRSQLERAVAILRTEAMRRPNDVRIWTALAFNLADLAGVAAGLAILDEAQAISGDGPDIRAARASLFARDPARLRSIDRLAGQIDTWPDGEQQRLLDGLLEVYDRTGDGPGMLATYRRIAGRRFGEVAVWDAVFERAVELKDEGAAKDAEAALAVIPTGQQTQALRNAWRALTTDGSDRIAARDGLLKRFGTQPDRADVCVALGRLQLVLGEAELAEASFDRAVLLEPNRYVTQRAKLEYQARQKPTALPATVQQLARDYRWTGEPYHRLMRQTALKLGSADGVKFLEVAAAPVENQPGHAAWLGECDLELKQPDAARVQFETAVRSPRATGDDWFRWIRVQPGVAPMQKAFEQAQTQLTGPASIHLGACLAEAGVIGREWKPPFKTSVDERMFAQASLTLKLSRFHRTDAIDLLEGFLKKAERSAADAAWARRNLAMLYVAQGNPLDRKRAQELLLDRSGAAEDTPDEKRATAAGLAGLARHLDSDERKPVVKRAIELLDEVATATQDRRDRFLLAQISRTSGERDGRIRGRQLLMELLEKDPKNIDYLVTGLEEASEPEDRDFAAACADRLLKNYPAEFRAVAAVARFEKRNGHPEKSLELANAYARTADSSPGDLHQRYGRAGELLDELARSPGVRRTPLGRTMTDSAVEKYEALFSTRPEAVVAVAGLLAADGRTDEAFAKIERHAKQLPMRVKLMAGLAVLRVGTGSPRQMALVGDWLAAAKAGEPGSVAVRLHEADYYNLKGDSAKAVVAYEAVLAADDRNVIALNNLAWLLAADPKTMQRAGELLDRATKEAGLTGELLDTRARIKIAARQFEAAERDLRQALAQEKTPLRMFHLALAMKNQTPAREEEAQTAFVTAREKGLKEQSVHPADVGMYRTMLGEKR